MISSIFIIIAISCFLGIMLMTIVLPVKPDALKIVGKLICSKDEKMEVLMSVASHHQPGERSIEIYCNNYGKRRGVQGKTLFLSFLFSSAVMLPFAAMILFLINKFWS